MKRRFPLQPAGLTLAVSLVLSSTLALGACQVKEAAPSAPAAATTAQDVTLVLKAPRQLQWNANNALTRADIAHVTLDLVQVDSAGNETGISSLDLQEHELDADVTFSHLRANTHYRVKAKAFGSAGETQMISVDDDRSWTEVQTNTEQAIVIAALKLKLQSVPPLAGGVYHNAGPNIAAAAVDSNGHFYYCEPMVHVIYKVDTTQQAPANKALFAGVLASAGSTDTASNTTSTFWQPRVLTFDSSDNLFVVDGNTGAGNSRIRKVKATGGVETLPGAFDNPGALAVLPDGSVLVADNLQHKIFTIPWNGATYGAPTVFAGSGATDAGEGNKLSVGLGTISAIARHPSGAIYISDASNNRIRVIESGRVRTLRFNNFEDNYVQNAKGLVFDPVGNMYFLTGSGTLHRYTRQGEKQTLPIRNLATGMGFSVPMPAALAMGPGKTFYAVEADIMPASPGRIHRIR